MRRLCRMCQGKGSGFQPVDPDATPLEQAALTHLEASRIAEHLSADIEWLRGVYSDAAGRDVLGEVGRLLVDANDRLAVWLDEHRPLGIVTPEPCAHVGGYCAACEPFELEVQS